MQNIKKDMGNSWEHFNDCVESNLGTWQYYREIGSDIYQLQYFKPDDDVPSITLNLNKEEFYDLETLFPNIKECKKHEINIINSIRKATGMNTDLCTKAYEKTNNLEDAINFVNKNRPKF